MFKKKKIGQIMILLLFIAALCMQGVWGFLFQIHVDSHNLDNSEYIENRKKATKPYFSVFNYTEYFKEYEKYFDDNFPFRSKLISVNNLIDYYVFQKSSNREVIIGEDGWLFYRESLADYQRNNLYTEEQLEKILEDALTTKKYFEEKGIEYIIYIAPNKNSVYGEYMPDAIDTQEGMLRTQQVVDYLRQHSDLRIVYPLEELQQAAKENPEQLLYFKMDTHWNYMGGFWGANALLEELRVPTMNYEDITYEQVNEPVYLWNGYDLANMLGLNEYLDEDVNYRVTGYAKEEAVFIGRAAEDAKIFFGDTRAYTQNGDARKIFFARDSFGEAMTPYLASAFKEMYSVDWDAMTKATIGKEKPDVFIYEVVERYGLGGLNIENWKE